MTQCNNHNSTQPHFVRKDDSESLQEILERETQELIQEMKQRQKEAQKPYKPVGPLGRLFGIRTSTS